MNANQLLSLLPDSTLEELALETQVNKYAKKLHGELVFKLLIHCILSFKDNSLRMMESAYESVAFKLLNAKISNGTIRFSSISERLSVIEPVYFERLYQKCVEQYGAVLSPQKVSFIRFDSTIVALSGKLLKVGYQIKGSASSHLKQLKFTIGFSNLPVSVHFFTEQVYTSENVALKEAVFSIDPSKTDAIRIFDKGINARKTYDELTANQIPFISRLNPQSKVLEVSNNELLHHVQTPTLNIYSDRSVYLFKSHGPKATHPVRLIEANQTSSGEDIAFVTNISSNELSAADITVLYKYRWDIEVFFNL